MSQSAIHIEMGDEAAVYAVTKSSPASQEVSAFASWYPSLSGVSRGIRNAFPIRKQKTLPGSIFLALQGEICDLSGLSFE